jgi:hypothetical protein
MRFYILVFVCLVVLPFLYWLKQHLKAKRRQKIMEGPLPDKFIKIISEKMMFYKFLTEELKNELHRYVLVFLDEKSFEGCGGLEMNDEIRLTIASQACFLLLNKGETTFYPELQSIVVYPSAYVVPETTRNGVLNFEAPSVRLGESWTAGTVVLAWDDVEKGIKNFKSGHNVIIHEFSHQLDQEDGVADGAPVLSDNGAYQSWARVLSKEYKKLQKMSAKHHRGLMDDYGATDPAEFFAVATETFFEKGKKMRDKHPELYEQLKDYYRMDPADWF